MPRTQTRRRHNLPAHRLRLIGREHDLATVKRTLLDADGRLLTLTGTGGCGKTRLALETASALLDTFADGGWLVQLAPLADPDLVTQAVVSAVGLRERPGEPLLETLVGWIGARSLLLVLDNCEHLIDACARLIEALLDGCPRLRILTTSREPLRIPGELTWRVPSLEVPGPHDTPEQVLSTPSVQLFVERARAGQATFTPGTHTLAIGTICARLDGLPLAIELAAARVPTIDIDELVRRLDDSIRLLVGGGRTAPTRQQTLRATLDWSYGLLDAAEAAVLRRLAVFADDCRLAAAETVCAGADVGADQVVDALSQLVQKSLILANELGGHTRYRLLEPVRQYGRQLLVTTGELDGLRERHARYFLAFGEAR